MLSNPFHNLGIFFHHFALHVSQKLLICIKLNFKFVYKSINKIKFTNRTRNNLDLQNEMKCTLKYRIKKA